MVSESGKIMDINRLMLRLAAALIAIGAGSGCSTVRITDPTATATQQYLTSEAVAKAVAKLSFDALRGRTVFVDNAYLADAEKGFTTAEFRAAVFEAGCLIQSERSNAEIIIEMRSNGIGIDRYQSIVGLPSIAGPPTGSGTSVVSQAVITPEIAITKNLKQIGFASLSYVAYWADSGEIVAGSGPYVGKTLREDWWFLGFGPRTVGNVPVVDRDVQ
jgi:hypothetical protein